MPGWNISITVDEEAIQEAVRSLNELGVKLLPAATKRAINRTLGAGRTAAAKAIRKKYNVKSERIKRGIKITPATNQKLAGTIQARDEELSLGNFGLKQKDVKRGKRKYRQATAEIERGKRKVPKAPDSSIPGFIPNKAPMQVFSRGTDKRYPLERIAGPSVLQMAEKAAPPSEIRRVMEEALKTNLREAVRASLAASKGLTLKGR